MVSFSPLLAVLLLAAASPGLALLQSGYTQTQVIYASSKSEFPITANTTTTALVVLTFTSTSICYDISNVLPAVNLTAAHIHVGASNVSGPIYVGLFTANATTPAVLRACVIIPTASVDKILANPSAYYFNAHTVAQPAGAFRGQLGRTFKVNLLGSNEVPPNNSTVTGVALVTIGDTYVCYSGLSVSNGLGNLTQGHIHDGDKASAGPILIPLFSGVPSPTNCTGNLNPAITADVLDFPGEHYMNVHSAVFPAGAARAQLVEATDYTATLTLFATSASEVPALVVNSTASGSPGNLTAVLSITPTTICYLIIDAGATFAKFSAAHIHRGAYNESGPILITLFQGTYNPNACANFSDSGVLFDLVRNPQKYYFNIHNADYPAGVARAQLGPSFIMQLYGSLETDKPTDRNGSLILTIGYSSVCYNQLAFGGPFTNLTQGHIHNGTSSVAGPILVPLFTGVPRPPGCTPAPPATLAAIVANPTQYYVNIHSIMYPAGAARNQLAANQTVLNVI
ncbi:hypothetical protein KFL_007860010 [Klebsormidium nitens]|uniref:CHRD domain-containing protein n=1 Tax=Klebsormidium nitens TaxID=105231 RepID=A0A1Y1IKR5_KLENI|nr:hypothetical protein KFL_007860010 [Klebsormidium nitens]|eukprot:GAQ91440.1 hypothetical protein KFL_007860010 [Klebsormidium nitens]